MIRIVPAVLLALGSAGPAHAQVYKCVDGSGRTTYQQEACAKTEKGARVDLLPDNGSTRDSATLEAQWAAAAKQGQVVNGMPKKYVQAVYGTPTEVRGASASDRVSEVWVFRNAGGTRRVGFLDGRVAFDRAEDGGPGPPPTADLAEQAARRDVKGSPIAARREILPGRDCGNVIAEAGRPDRSEGFQVGTAGGVSAGMRHFYDDDGSQPPQPLAFTCVNGLVQNVERNLR